MMMSHPPALLLQTTFSHHLSVELQRDRANPAFIANQMDHENAEMVYTVYSAWINALDGDRIAFLNPRIGGYNGVPRGGCVLIKSLKLW